MQTARILDLLTLTVDLIDRAAVITLSRPEQLNTYNGQMMSDLLEALDFADVDDRVRSVVLTSTGRAFCAGADISQGADSFDYDKQAERGEAGRLGETTDGRDPGGKIALRIFRSLKPVICAISGDAVGFGATLTLAADVRMISTTARLGFIFTRRGVVPEACSTWFLPQLVGISVALDWCLSGRLVGAAELKESGLVRSCHDGPDLLPAALFLAATYAEATSPVSSALTRLMLWQMAGAALPGAAHELDSAAMQLRGRSADAREGLTAFLEKRATAFPQRVSQSLSDIQNLPWPANPIATDCNDIS